jgi:hypothetical protein
LEADPDLRKRAGEVFLNDLVRKQINREAIAEITVEELKALPAPDSDARRSGAPISQDWLNRFGPFAENASSDELRALFGRILAGEIRRPGSFSIRALEILASISQGDAATFQKLCNMSFSNGQRTVILLAVPGWHGPSSHWRVPNPSKTLGEQLTSYGTSAFDLLNMRTIGLFAGLPEEEYPEWDILLGDNVDYAGKRVSLHPTVIEGRIGVISFTDAGHQLRGLLVKTPHETYTPALLQVFKDAGVTVRGDLK